jgi:carboxyl-terminal processing protease
MRLVSIGLRGLAVLAALAAMAGGPKSTQASPGTNRVLGLDGKTGYMEVADGPALHSLSNALTIELWFNAKSFSREQGGVTSLVRKNVTAERENFFLRFRTIDDVPTVEFSPGHGVGVVRAPFRFRPGTWYHLAGSYDGATASVFVNGTALGSTSLSRNINLDDSTLVVGRGDPEYSDGEYFEGRLDEIRIWSQARSQAQLQANATVPCTGKEEGLVGCWNFDNGQAQDVSAHGLKGVLNGDARIVESKRPAALEPADEAGPAAKAPELSTDKRVAVVEDLWSKLSEIYPALEYKGISGRSWIEPTFERVRQAKDDEEFYGLLRELIASLKDTHTRIVSYPGEPKLESPPVVLNQVEGKVAVFRADESTGLKPGDVLVSVDDQPVADRLAERIRRVCGSTDRGRVRGACGQLLTGPPGTTVTLRVEGADGAARQVTLHRGPKPDFMNEPAVSWRALGDSLGYIRIASWGGNDLVAQFDRALEEFKERKGLVVDVRGNGGGSDQVADQVNGRLIDQPVVSSIDFWRQAGTDQFRKTIGRVQPRGPWTYRGRVAVLIDEGCASACEHFVSGIEAMGRVLLVGTPTNGAGGGPTVVTLCDRTKVAISRALGLRANGVVFEGHGIPPHLVSSPSLDHLRHGRDAALEMAETWLLSGDPVPGQGK